MQHTLLSSNYNIEMCLIFIPHAEKAHLIFVFDDVGVDLVQRRHAVELAEVQAGLLC